ncbi:MAG: zinc ribbon domain-containing protein, partial [Acidobacteria bacterium]|nr:zinc ribbon domain-containing protein [Acidobacteriota bacterium]
MSPCRNCGNINAAEAIFCRTCGTKLAAGAPASQAPMQNQFEMPSPRPYSWKTDEFSVKNNEARGTMPIIEGTRQQTPLAHAQPQFLASFRCPKCSTHLPPMLERKISTAGWITFAVLLVTVF